MPISVKSIRPKRFALINPGQTAIDSRRNMREYLMLVAKRMEKYPPKRGTGGYQRTYRLQDGWKNPVIEISADGSEGVLYNSVAYSVYVNGPKYGGRGIGQRQTEVMRRLGWQSITDVARETRRDFVELMNRAYKGSPG